MREYSEDVVGRVKSSGDPAENPRSDTLKAALTDRHDRHDVKGSNDDWTHSHRRNVTRSDANRRRIRGGRGQRLLRKRGELLERPSAHLYETDGLRRLHVRGHKRVLKRLLVQAGAFNLGLWMRTLFGVGTPHTLQRRVVALGAMTTVVWTLIDDARPMIWSKHSDHIAITPPIVRTFRRRIGSVTITTCTTGC